jgi:hypothetical protein
VGEEEARGVMENFGFAEGKEAEADSKKQQRPAAAMTNKLPPTVLLPSLPRSSNGVLCRVRPRPRGGGGASATTIRRRRSSGEERPRPDPESDFGTYWPNQHVRGEERSI